VRPLDPRLLRRVRGARTGLVADAALGVLATVTLLAQATLVADVVARAFAGTPPSRLAGALVGLAVVVLGRAVLAGAFESVGRLAAASVMSELRLALVEHRLRRDPRSSDGAEAAEVATAATQGVDALEAYFAGYLPQLVLAVLVPVTVLIWAAVVDTTSAAIMLVTVPLIPVFMVLIGRATESRTRARWLALARLSNHFLDVMRGLPTLRAFNRGEAQAGRIEETGERYRATTMEVLRVSFLSGAVLELMATIATALVAVTLGVRLIDGDVTLRAALTVLLLTPELYAPIRALGARFHASADGLGAAERILELIGGDDDQSAGAPASPPADWQEVRLDGVSLWNPGRTGRVLDRFDLRIRRGEVVALVGPSGAGKTTVGELLLGLRQPDRGRVCVDDSDLRALDLAQWRRQVGWLPQRPTMFRGSIRDNISMADPTASDGRVRLAATLAGADEFIREFRAGYDTMIGDGERRLSAGEGRRIALARALLRDAPLLILDEPSANLDSESAAAIAASIRSAAPGRAVLLIEHNPDVVRMADRVVRIDRAGTPVLVLEEQAVAT
jgi:thiol reductant ABC exporter CydD subunit